MRVRYTGSRAGAEVVELYVHDDRPNVDRPAHELKGFRRVELKPGESKMVQFKLNRADFSYWNARIHDWKADPGVFEVPIGSSSRDVRLRARITLLK